MARAVGAPTMIMSHGSGIAPSPQAYAGAGAPGRAPFVMPAAVPFQGSSLGPGMPRPLPAAPQLAKAPVALGQQPFPKTTAVVHQGHQAFMKPAAVEGPPAYKASMMPHASSPANAANPVQSGMGAAGAQGSARRSGIVLCVGDSLTAGRKNTTDSYPAQLEKALQDNKAGNFMMKNTGVWGTTCDAITGQLQQAIAGGLPLAFVLVLGGTNDIMQYHPAHAILAKLKRLHDMAALAPGRPVVGVFTIPRSALFNPGHEETRRVVNAGLREMVQQAPPQTKFLIDLDSVSVDLAKDGIHYHGEGYEQFAQLAFQAMSELIG